MDIPSSHEHSVEPSIVLKENLQFLNIMTREMQPFVPISPGKVGVYTCGPTVYNRAHIGNMRAYLMADTLGRTLKRCGYDLNHVMNITDVGHLTSDADEGEDKMAKSARLERKTAWQVAEAYTNQFLADTDKLNIVLPTVICKATDHIPEQIELVRRLEQKGFIYNTDDGIYFNTAHLEDYGRLMSLDHKGIQAGIRVEMGQKKNPTDFALWKFAAPGEKRDMEWDSPWGRGFPGWHIECSAMAMKYLGEHFDIHTGGVDHGTHHSNEDAQSRAATGLDNFANYWMHVEFLTSGHEKMSKSLGNIVNIDELDEQGISPLTYRFFCLTSRYGQKLRLTENSFVTAKAAYASLGQTVQRVLEKATPGKLVDLSDTGLALRKSFDLALSNNLNTPIALSILWKVLKEPDMFPQEKYTLIRDFDQALGLGLMDMGKEPRGVVINVIPDEILKLASARQEFRKARQFAEADAARDQITAAGYTVKDTPAGFEVTKN